jgi:hypothetical protein
MLGHKPDKVSTGTLGRKRLEGTAEKAPYREKYLQFGFAERQRRSGIASASQRPGREYQKQVNQLPSTHLSGATGF